MAKGTVVQFPISSQFIYRVLRKQNSWAFYVKAILTEIFVQVHLEGLNLFQKSLYLVPHFELCLNIHFSVHIYFDSHFLFSKLQGEKMLYCIRPTSCFSITFVLPLFFCWWKLDNAACVNVKHMFTFMHSHSIKQWGCRAKDENENSFQGRLIKAWQRRIRVSSSLAIKVIAHLQARKDVQQKQFLRNFPLLCCFLIAFWGGKKHLSAFLGILLFTFLCN